VKFLPPLAVVAAVNFDDLVVDKIGIVASEKGNNLGNLGGVGEATFVNFGGFFGDEIGGEILVHLGVNPTRGNGVDIDGRCELDGEVVGKIDEGGFRSVIGDTGWEERIDAISARNIDNFAVSLLVHETSDDLASEKWSDEIGGEGSFPIFDGVVGEFFVDGDASVIDEDVNSTESIEGLLDERLNIVLFANVSSDNNSVDMIL